METEALLLLQKPTGESTLRLTFLSPVEGHLTVFKKTGKVLSKRAQPDLFDTADIHIQASKDGKFHHLSSYHPTVRRTRIPRDYPSFQTACTLASFFAGNAQWIEDTGRTYRLACTALDALDGTTAHPSIIELKTLYTLLKQEGYPVREDWKAKIPQTQQAPLAQFLHSPLANLGGIPSAEAQPFLEKLQHWARHHTSFHFT